MTRTAAGTPAVERCRLLVPLDATEVAVEKLTKAVGSDRKIGREHTDSNGGPAVEFREDPFSNPTK